MPPHLHPRSRMTSSLFATTVVASFFVVALPHMLPCPAPRVKYADSERTPDGRRRRRRRAEPAEVKNGIAQFESSNEDFDRAFKATKPARPCPIPKPGGVVGELMGFKKSKTESEQSQGQNER
ncbi:uncharacterized protein BCR38DRAFT_409070 [Pseudomassariella vexata]|uniref:Alpha-1,3-mannosyltransferase n=1 Tax=Pseudomassariella vexata TaxID=1141098 RepID=A0A1Y2E1C4_9PEZI|nr:uncharacterized protein BCR38DRAFT_409070 [Pseudomassariella vexata]ORY65361.1 hypothetical protein BCR38DRAFT_409070 [Pseudomassariella vexata]